MFVSPSLISVDFTILRDQLHECDLEEPYSYHMDIMDGHFVNNITVGPSFVRAVRKITDRKIESHLMIERPDKFYPAFLDAGTDLFLIHIESPLSVGKLLKKMVQDGVEYGVVLNPETPFEKAIPFLPDASALLLMTVHPGFSGQRFIEDSLKKIGEARKYIDENSLPVKIEVDGGINDITARSAKKAGADVAVSASYIFRGNIRERIRILKSI